MDYQTNWVAVLAAARAATRTTNVAVASTRAEIDTIVGALGSGGAAQKSMGSVVLLTGSGGTSARVNQDVIGLVAQEKNELNAIAAMLVTARNRLNKVLAGSHAVERRVERAIAEINAI